MSPCEDTGGEDVLPLRLKQLSASDALQYTMILIPDPVPMSAGRNIDLIVKCLC